MESQFGFVTSTQKKMDDTEKLNNGRITLAENVIDEVIHVYIVIILVFY